MVVRHSCPEVLSRGFVDVLAKHPSGKLCVVAAAPCDILLSDRGVLRKPTVLLPVNRIDLEMADVPTAVRVADELTVLAVLDAGQRE
ncbi:hypothetical protein SDC9_187043 [bioreactor metagenome]|uniref:Uncharacterized protein n=1 Tax=bioreactor metagenome TaxID=1076179 RepID=A0A645HKH0_9ZZZZ